MPSMNWFSFMLEMLKTARSLLQNYTHIQKIKIKFYAYSLPTRIVSSLLLKCSKLLEFQFLSSYVFTLSFFSVYKLIQWRKFLLLFAHRHLITSSLTVIKTHSWSLSWKLQFFMQLITSKWVNEQFQKAKQVFNVLLVVFHKKFN